MNGQTITVPFDLEHPIRAAWRFWFELGQTRFYAGGHRIELQARLPFVARLLRRGFQRRIKIGKEADGL
jgi:hypothetical protein